MPTQTHIILRIFVAIIFVMGCTLQSENSFAGEHRLTPNFYKTYLASQTSNRTGILLERGTLSNIDNNDVFHLPAVNLAPNGTDLIRLRYQKTFPSKIKIEVRQGGLQGPLIGRIESVPVTSGTWGNIDIPVSNAKGVQDLHFRVTGQGRIDSLSHIQLASSNRYVLQAENADRNANSTLRQNREVIIRDEGYLLFENVNLGQGFSELLLRYSKGNIPAGTLTMHINDMNSPAVLSLNLETTGSWQNFQTQTIGLQNLSGKNDIYFKFKGPGSVANVDFFILRGTETVADLNIFNPTKSESLNTFGNLLAVGDFESSLTFENVNLSHNTDVEISFARYSQNPNFVDQMILDVWSGGVNGLHLGQINLGDTGGWDDFETKRLAIRGETGLHDLTFRFKGYGGLNINGIRLNRDGQKYGEILNQPTIPFETCINVSGYLEAPRDQYWGHKTEQSDIQSIALQGFDAIRLSIRWDDYLNRAAPYRINNNLPTPSENIPNDGEGIFTTVDQILYWSKLYGVKLIIDVHHYDELYLDAEAEREKFLSLWTQISEHYKTESNDDLIFEIINEPRDDSGTGAGMTRARTNEFNALALDIIRKTNPDRPVIYGTGSYGGIDGVRMAKPPADPNLIMSVHYYEPFDFTHQGAEFTTNPPPFPAVWGTNEEKTQIEEDFDFLTALSEDLALPIFVGEYGVIRNANTDGVGRDKLVDETERGEWTQFIKSQVESHNFAGCYFDYATGFAATEPETKRWIPQILNALIEFPRQLHYSPYVPYINPF